MFNEVKGVDEMISNIGDFFRPAIDKIQPFLRILSAINLYLIVGVFLGLLAYMIFVRKHSVINKLTRSTNYFAALILLGLYLMLTRASLRLGTDSLGNTIAISPDFIIMPLAVKLFGPIVGCFFGMIQYGASFMLRNEVFNFSFMLVAGISAMIYGRYIYAHKTSYLRCFVTKLFVNILCNVILTPFFEFYADEFVIDAITNRLVIQVVFAPAQALAIYISLIVMRKLRKTLSEVSWSL